MKTTQNDIDTLPKLSLENMENIFSVYQDDTQRYFYNLLETVQIPSNLPANLFSPYNVKYGDTWPYISFKIYGTPNLWWLILHANRILDPTVMPLPGQTLQCFKALVAGDIITQVTTQT